jgi:hypothetical protein
MEAQTGRELVHDGGKLLQYLLDRLSIPRTGWVHSYCYRGQKKELPTTKKERSKALEQWMVALALFIRKEAEEVPNRQLEALALGRLACECLTGSSEIGKKAGTCWKPRQEWREIGLKRIWISYSTDAALFDPGLTPAIYGVIAAAARTAGFGICSKTPQELTPFDWSEYV